VDLDNETTEDIPSDDGDKLFTYSFLDYDSETGELELTSYHSGNIDFRYSEGDLDLQDGEWEDDEVSYDAD
jgi:hypothetical protein